MWIAHRMSPPMDACHYQRCIILQHAGCASKPQNPHVLQAASWHPLPIHLPALPACLQLVGAGLRVSCASRVIAPCLGAVGVGAASALSGHLSRHFKRQTDAGKGIVEALATPFWGQPLDANEALLDVLSGIALFKVGA